MAQPPEPNELAVRYEQVAKERDLYRRKFERVRQLLDLVPDIVYAIDEDGRIIDANKSFAEFYNTTVEEARGKLLSEVDPRPEQAAELLETIRRLSQSTEPVFMPEEKVVDAHGQTRFFQTYDIPFRQLDANRPALMGVATDITQRRYFEQQIRQKDRLEHDLLIARKIQQDLLPKHGPDALGFDIAGWNRPADETGGDYYDWMSLPDGRVAVTIADATGHGIGPALIVAVCRAYFRASRHEPDPIERMVARVNRLLNDDLSDGRFVTAAVGILDPQRGRLQLYSAGHGPMLYFDAQDRVVHCWNADDLPLGILAESTGGKSRTIDMKTGDALVLITDGLFEASNLSGELFGIERLTDAIAAHASGESRSLIEQVRNQVDQFASGQPACDDLTMLVVKRTGQGC